MTANRLDHGDLAPGFTASSTHGDIDFDQWSAGSWVVFTTHPDAFTPVCSTEIIAEARQYGELQRRGVRALTLASGKPEDHELWVKQLESASGVEIGFPVLADADGIVADLYGFARTDPSNGKRFLSRSAVLIDPERRIRWYVTYPQRTGRSFGEVLRVLDSLRLIADYDLATPAEWTPGADALLPVSVPTAQAAERFGEVTEVLPYIRTVRVPVQR